MNRRILRAATLLLLIIIPPPNLLPSPQRLAGPPAHDSMPSTPSLLPPASRQQQRTAYVPILIYHHIRQSSPTDSRVLRRLTVTPQIFDQQMKYLQDDGYHVVSFESLENFFEQGSELPTRSVIISFDDGWEDPYINAVPILKKYHYSATFFVVTNYLGGHAFLSLDQLRAMTTIGMSIGSHSRSHSYLERVTHPDVLWDEIHGSKEFLETQLSVPIKEFAYPYGSYNAATVAMVKLAGYKAARTCNFGIAHSTNDIYWLSAITAPNDLATFARIFSEPTALVTPNALSCGGLGQPAAP